MSGQKLLTRTLQEMNDHGTTGVSLPKEMVDSRGLEPGDEIPIADIDPAEGTITFQL